MIYTRWQNLCTQYYLLQVLSCLAIMAFRTIGSSW